MNSSSLICISLCHPFWDYICCFQIFCLHLMLSDVISNDEKYNLPMPCKDVLVDFWKLVQFDILQKVDRHNLMICRLHRLLLVDLGGGESVSNELIFWRYTWPKLEITNSEFSPISSPKWLSTCFSFQKEHISLIQKSSSESWQDRQIFCTLNLIFTGSTIWFVLQKLDCEFFINHSLSLKLFIWNLFRCWNFNSCWT